MHLNGFMPQKLLRPSSLPSPRPAPNSQVMKQQSVLFLACALALGAAALWIDLPLTQLVAANLTPALDEFFDDLSGVADAETYALMALGAYGIGLWALPRHAVRRWAPVAERLVRGGLFMLLTMASGGILTFVLKHLVARARPSVFLDNAFYGLATPFSGSPYNSFPSSHTLTAFAVAAVLAHLLPRWRWPLMALATVVGLCRVLTLEHFLTDVIVAALLAIACARFWAPRVLAPHMEWPLRGPWRWHRKTVR